ncbi:MAG TPA: ATP-binding protein [Vicinamibacterales bacterium]|nr:ATP-binding protein [Vicinamibacterales bacterium]
MHLTPSGYAFLGLTGMVAGLVAVMVFAMMRFASAARDARRTLTGTSRAEVAFLTAALQDAVAKLRAQERATAARAEASERLSSEIVTSLTAGLLVAGVDGDIKILNPAGRRLLDLSDEAPPDAARYAIDEAQLSQVVDECLSSGEPILRRAVRLVQPRHGVSHLGVTASPLFDENGRVHGAICLFTDLTAVKDLEEQLRLKESLATVGELTAGIAHEFRNGLATIHGYSKLLDLDALPPSYRPYVEGIRAETNSLSEVVTNFLNFARPAQLTLSHIDLRAICERAADDVRAEVRELGGSLELRGEFAIVDGDEVLLRQAISNLLRNAVEACAGAAARPIIVVHSDIDRGQHVTRLTVSDNGPGVPADLRDRIFRPFVTSKRNGTGLGLALVQKIVVYHNGRIIALPGSNAGATFQVTLPLA